MRETYDIEAFIAGYIECALWSTTEISEMGDALDENYSEDDLSADCLASMREDCESFADCNSGDLRHLDAGQCGHDFWLTRNGHGAGFWDRGLGAKGDRLSAACKPYGSVDLYVGDDGKIHSQ